MALSFQLEQCLIYLLHTMQREIYAERNAKNELILWINFPENEFEGQKESTVQSPPQKLPPASLDYLTARPK